MLIANLIMPHSIDLDYHSVDANQILGKFYMSIVIMTIINNYFFGNR